VWGHARFATMRGYFGIGVEGISKPMNVGNLFRTAHAFGASFVFAIAPAVNVKELYQSDTSQTDEHVPLYVFDNVKALQLPKGCTLVGVELLDGATDLPSFSHPPRSAYVFGPERGSLSQPLIGLCSLLVKIPTRFSVNVGVAGAIVMYDRTVTRGRFAARPQHAGGPLEPLEPHVHGTQKFRGLR
jgi:tRNA G18 (ribose-2'-O)-methylase SpoU